MRMGVAVIADVVTALVNFLNVVGVFVNPVTDEEKRRLYVVFVENIQQVFGLLIAPRGVK